MNYRKAEKFNVDLSLLGFGGMRLPLASDNPADIDKEEAIKMIRYAIDNGVNYVDTAWVYHMGESEKVVGLALRGGYREKVKLATKNPTWEIKAEEDWSKYLELQLEKLQTDHIDFYLQHSLDIGRWEDVKRLNMWESAQKAKREGKIKYYGFSFHDDLDVFKEIINSYDWDFCQIQLNYLDGNYQAGLEGLRIAREKGIPVIIMEPLRGGTLASKLPDFAKEMMQNCEIQHTPVEWAFKYLTDMNGILTILSGMSTMEQVKDNLRIFSSDMTKENNMNKEEIEFINNLMDKWNSRRFIKCTGCEYCMPCPNGVNIPGCFKVYNILKEEGFTSKMTADAMYSKLKESGSDAASCIECGACEPQCPQHIEIISKLKKVRKVFEEVV